MIHFIHRGLAYIILVWIILWTIRLSKEKGSFLFESIKRIPLYLTVLQVLLGILSILTSTGIVPGKWGTFEWMAQLHQLTGMCLLLSLIVTLFVLRKRNMTTKPGITQIELTD